MANKDFEVKQILKAYRQGLISDELFAEQMQDIGENGASGGLDVANVFDHRGSEIAKLQETPLSPNRGLHPAGRL